MSYCLTPNCDETTPLTGRRGRPAQYCDLCIVTQHGARPTTRERAWERLLKAGKARCGCGQNYSVMTIDHICLRPVLV